MAEWTTAQGLANFGNWLKRTRHDSSLWPPELHRWFDWHYSFSNKLTQEQLCEWFADVSGDESLKRYIYRIKTYEKWAEIKDVSEARVKNIKEMNFFIALGQSGFLSMKTPNGYRPIFSDNSWIFSEVLRGNINPITDNFPIYPVGRGVGPRLATFIDGVVAFKGGNIQDLMIRVDFAAGNKRWLEKDILPGSWFSDLIEGKIYDVDINDLKKIASAVENYLRRYNDSDINFSVGKLIAILNRDKKDASIMVDQPPESVVSSIAQAVWWHCAAIDVDYKSYVVKTLVINWDRWIEIESGNQPTHGELDKLEENLRRPREFFEDAWVADQRMANNRLMNNLGNQTGS